MKKSLLKALSIVLVLIMAVSFAAVSAENIPDVEDAYVDEDGAIIVPIDLSKHENVTEISFTKESLQLLTDAAKDVEEEVKLLIDLGQVTVTVSMEALEAVNETEGNKILSVVVNNDYNKLSKLQQDALKGKDLKLVISAFWTNENGEIISDFKGGDITLAINDFKPEKGKKLEDYTIVYISDKGEIEIMPTFVDGQILCFVTGHFSDFVIMTKADAQALANPNPNTSDQVPVTFLVLVLVLASATALAVLKKRYN